MSSSSPTGLVKFVSPSAALEKRERPSRLIPLDTSGITLTEAEGESLSRAMSALKTGASAVIPLRCPGEAGCPFRENCPLVALDRKRKRDLAALDDEDERIGVSLLSDSPIPRGKPCLVEVALLNDWTQYYLEEYEVNEKSFTEFQMVRELAEIDLMMWRINNGMSKPEHASFTITQSLGINKQGDEITRVEVDPLFEVKERLSNRKSRLTKLLVGDRQEKYKREAALRTKSEDDPSISASRLRIEIEKLQRKAASLSENPGISVTEITDAVLSPEDLIGFPDGGGDK